MIVCTYVDMYLKCVWTVKITFFKFATWISLLLSMQSASVWTYLHLFNWTFTVLYVVMIYMNLFSSTEKKDAFTTAIYFELECHVNIANLSCHNLCTKDRFISCCLENLFFYVFSELWIYITLWKKKIRNVVQVFISLVWVSHYFFRKRLIGALWHTRIFRLYNTGQNYGGRKAKSSGCWNSQQELGLHWWEAPGSLHKWSKQITLGKGWPAWG